MTAKPSNKKILILLVIMVALVLVLGLGALSAKYVPSTTSNPSGVSCGSYPVITPQSVLYQFQSNQAAADSEWTGKVICFSDYVGSVDKTGSGQYASCVYYTQSAYQYGCNSPSQFNGWVIYNWANSQAAAAVPTHGTYFTGTCTVSAYSGYGQFAFAGGKALILIDCQLYG